jgi:hypothetical protein
MRKGNWLSLAIATVVIAGCVPSVMAPTVTATAGPGKLPADFAADQTACAAQANQQMAPAVQAANNQIVGNALLGSSTSQTTQANLQQQYNVAYSQCIYAKGDSVPGWTPAPAEAETEPAPVTHHYRHYAKKKPSTTTTNANFVAPAPTASSESGSFVEPAPATPATPAAAGGSGGFAVPAPAAH